MSARDRETRDVVHPQQLACCVFVEPGETVEEAEARHRALAETHESVLAALARLLLGREAPHRQEPDRRSCLRTDDYRGLER